MTLSPLCPSESPMYSLQSGGSGGTWGLVSSCNITPAMVGLGMLLSFLTLPLLALVL